MEPTIGYGAGREEMAFPAAVILVAVRANENKYAEAVFIMNRE
jgi:hypothetical protein